MAPRQPLLRTSHLTRTAAYAEPLLRTAACRRVLLLQALPLVSFCWPPLSAQAEPVLAPPLPPPPPPPPPAVVFRKVVTDPLFVRLRSRYILFRPGETTFEAAGIVDSNPINKQNADRGLTRRGREQVRKSTAALRERGVDSPIIFYDNGVRATQTADIIASELSVPRASCEPEFRWLEARGLGALEGKSLRDATAALRKLDVEDIDNRVDPTDDGTPSDSVNELFSRLRNTIGKIENTYGGGDFIIVAGDAAVLSVFAAAACGVDLRQHEDFLLRPGEFYDLRELVPAVKEGRFEPMALRAPTDEEITRGREALRQLGPKVFADTDAGSWVLGEGVLR